MASAGWDEQGWREVREVLASSMALALGIAPPELAALMRPVGSAHGVPLPDRLSGLPPTLGFPDRAIDTDLLHFVHGGVEMLPLWTRFEALGPALQLNPEWMQLSCLPVHGAAALRTARPIQVVVLNPWSEWEYQLPR